MWADVCAISAGREPADYDVSTDATPGDEELFPGSLTVGAQFGVVIVPRDAAQVEVATFRSDIGHSDGRHPDRVVFSKTPQEDVSDAHQRISSDPATGEVRDYVGGRNDLKTGVIRTIGEPFLRFSEDKLRLARAVRFAALGILRRQRRRQRISFIMRTALSWLGILADLVHFVCLGSRSRSSLAAENLFLRNQLAFYHERKVKPRRADNPTRLTLVMLSRWFNWRDALTVVRPTTFITWHRKGFRLSWCWKSAGGRRPIPVELQRLIQRIARKNASWVRSGSQISCCLSWAFGCRRE